VHVTACLADGRLFETCTTLSHWCQYDLILDRYRLLPAGPRATFSLVSQFQIFSIFRLEAVTPCHENWPQGRRIQTLSVA
jgi:hypothetical protein